MTRVSRGTHLARVVAHCRAREDGLVSIADIVAITGMTRRDAARYASHRAGDGWLERVDVGAYRLTAKAEAWGAPMQDRVVALANEGAVTGRFLAWRLGITLKAAYKWLEHLGRQGRIERRALGVYGRVREVVCAAE